MKFLRILQSLELTLFRFALVLVVVQFSRSLLPLADSFVIISHPLPLVNTFFQSFLSFFGFFNFFVFSPSAWISALDMPLSTCYNYRCTSGYDPAIAKACRTLSERFIHRPSGQNLPEEFICRQYPKLCRSFKAQNSVLLFIFPKAILIILIKKGCRSYAPTRRISSGCVSRLP